MAKKTANPKELPEYGELINIMQTETASILTDYIQQSIGIPSQTPEPGQGIFINWDRVLRFQTYQELAWYDLYQEVERDPYVASILDTAKLNVAGMPYDMFAYTGGAKKPTKRNQEIADSSKRMLDGLGYFPQHLYNLMDAKGKGFSVSEIIWKIVNNEILAGNLLNRPQRRFQFDATDRSLRLRDIQSPYFGIALPDKKFIVHRCSSTWENPFGDAKDQSLYWMWLFKKTVIKFYMQHLQVGASSVPIVKHPAGANKELKAEALEIAKMIRNGAYGRVPDNFSVEYAEANNAMQNAMVYDQFIRFCNEEMSKCVNGQSLTTEAASAEGKGTQALGNVHRNTQNQRDIFGAKGLASTINNTLIKWYVDFNFANVEGYPEFTFDLQEKEDLKSESEIVKTLSDAGFEFDEGELSEKFKWSIKKKEAKPIPIIGKTVNELKPELNLQGDK